MKLAEYMEMAKITEEVMGEKIGKDRSLVSRYKRGEVVPPLDVIAKIDAATNSAVSFKDFLTTDGAAA